MLVLKHMQDNIKIEQLQCSFSKLTVDNQFIVYQGLISSSGTTIYGDRSGVYVFFTFENASTTLDSNVDISNAQLFDYVTSQSRWSRDSEFGELGDTETIVERNSAVIMLVLDCTSSLDAGGANGFAQMKTAANNFVDVFTGN